MSDMIYRLTVRVGDGVFIFRDFDNVFIDANTIILQGDRQEMAYIQKSAIDDFTIEFVERPHPLVKIFTNLVNSHISYVNIRDEGIFLY